MSYYVVFNKAEAERRAAERLNAAVELTHCGEDGFGYAVHTTREFNIAQQSEQGYCFEMRPEYIYEITGNWFDDQSPYYDQFPDPTDAAEAAYCY